MLRDDNEPDKYYKVLIHPTKNKIEGIGKEFDYIDVEQVVRNDLFYVIILSVVNYWKGVKMRHYVIVRKPIKKIESLINYCKERQGNKGIRNPQEDEPGLVEEEDDVMMFENAQKLRGMKMRATHRFVHEKKANNNIGLSFEKYID